MPRSIICARGSWQTQLQHHKRDRLQKCRWQPIKDPFLLPLRSSTDWGTSCILRSFWDSMLQVVLCTLLSIVGRSAWFRFCGITRESACQERRSVWHSRTVDLTWKAEDGSPEAIYYLPWPSLTLSLLLSPMLTDRKSKQNLYESTNLTWVPGMYRCELKKKCVGFGSSGVGSPSDVELTKTATCDSTKLWKKATLWAPSEYHIYLSHCHVWLKTRFV